MTFLALRVSQHRRDHNQRQEADNIENIVTYRIVNTHKASCKSRQLPADLVEHRSKPRNNEGHYEYDYQNNKNEYEDRICQCPLNFFGQFITIVEICR